MLSVKCRQYTENFNGEMVMAQYKPGESGNPAGKKVGTLNKRTQLAKLLDPHAEAIINKTVELALAGDINALRLCIDRLIPKAKEDTATIVIPDSKDITNDQMIREMLCQLSGQELQISELKRVVSVVHDRSEFGWV